MNAVRITFSLLLAIVLSGCVNLKEVRDYASESARLSAYTELTTRFRDTYEREQPYFDGEAERADDRKRKAAYEDFLNIHYSVSLYMQTLATLAGEETFDISTGIKSLAAGINSYPDFGIDKKHADAMFNMSNVIARWATSEYQKGAVRSMIKEGDAPLQTTLNGMTVLVRLYRKTNENEKKRILGYLETEILMIPPKDKLQAMLARAHEQAKRAEYRNAELLFDEAERGINSIAEGHRRLLDNINNLSGEQLKAVISRFARDIKTVRNNLNAVRG